MSRLGENAAILVFGVLSMFLLSLCLRLAFGLQVSSQGKFRCASVYIHEVSVRVMSDSNLAPYRLHRKAAVLFKPFYGNRSECVVRGEKEIAACQRLQPELKYPNIVLRVDTSPTHRVRYAETRVIRPEPEQQGRK